MKVPGAHSGRPAGEVRLVGRDAVARAPAPNEGASRPVERARARLMLVALGFGLASAAVGVRLVDLTVLRRTGEVQAAPHAPAVPAQTSRGQIIDRNGLLLATSIGTASVYADPKFILNPADTAKKLVKVLPGLSQDEVLRKLQQPSRFVWIKRHITPRQQQAVNRLGLPGIEFQSDERRVYPSGKLTTHIVGFSDVDNRGLAGIEQSFNEQLRSGQTVQLSVDLRIQHILRRELAAAVQQFSAIGGGGIIMDVRTGEVIAMVSLPDFEPHEAGTADPDTRFNRITLGVYEVGSTFKILNTAMALESGKVRLRDGFDASRPIRYGRFTINDYHGKNRWLTVPEIFIYSSNIGSAHMATAVGTPYQRAFLSKLGFTRASPIELPEAGKPIVPSPWREINTMTIAFGHGLSISPMHLASSVAAVVNGGILFPPTLIRRGEENPPAGTRVLAPQHSDAMRKLLRLVVEQGTGTKADAPGYVVGGKTGTAEKSKGRGYSQKALLSSFIAAFPMTSPRYAVYVMLDEPRATKETHGYATGGWVAAPVVSRVVAQIAPLLGVEQVDQSAPEVRQSLALDPTARGKQLASQ